MPALLCRLQAVEKSFGANRVLKRLNLDLPAGEVTVLMGANGAGKSTLVKILSGVHGLDAGSVELEGRPYQPATPSEAIRAGVVTVHQSINDGVIPDLDVASNLMIDRLAEKSYGFRLNRTRLFAEAQAIADRMGLALNVRQPVRELGVADRQLIAIARAMAHQPKLLILDEPTSSLSAAEAERLFGFIEQFTALGVAVLYISHRMSDIRRIGDRIVSMRDGEVSGLFEGEDLDYEGAVQAMLGHRMTDVDIRIPDPNRCVVEIDALRLKAGSRPISLDLRENEIVAVTGLLGSGKTALAQALFGMKPAQSGGVRLDGRPYAPTSPQQAIASGVFMSPKDRASNAVVPQFNLLRNMTLPFLERYSRFSFVSRKAEKATANAMIEALAIVCRSDADEIGTLSGGNQQKVMLARWLAQDCRLLLLDEPFQGVDIRSRRDIGRKIRETAANRATLVFVSELDEALEIADRIIVMSEHAVSAEFRNENVDINEILTAVTGRAPAAPSPSTQAA
ncbi:monosaccharide ABC transporter ATP-binding protein (CUT2 family) [Hoeflea marina]|uniref:Monosaccharide ABC transporter ATP-binding protein (CUT2 family) n=1 Tax=Hoeflea marina TaxID=274592 RepID=A0A317PNF6_9HYPH|nr:sugar ABC transporter ATP-binding protein [Hoeflea marina]PWW00031.1 monosaccharide ABC transporter ATP-binding protein (CUT2 family) [Hoeflea marina]